MITNVFRAMSDVYHDASVVRNRLMDANISNIPNHQMIVCALANKHPPFYVRYHEDVIIAWYNRDHTYIVMINRYIRRRRSPQHLINDLIDCCVQNLRNRLDAFV